MKSQSFWEADYEGIRRVDEGLLDARRELNRRCPGAEIISLAIDLSGLFDCLIGSSLTGEVSAGQPYTAAYESRSLHRTAEAFRAAKSKYPQIAPKFQ